MEFSSSITPLKFLFKEVKTFIFLTRRATIIFLSKECLFLRRVYCYRKKPHLLHKETNHCYK